MSPNKPNMYYEVVVCTDIDQDFASVLNELCIHKISTQRLILYCKSLNVCSDLYAYFISSLGVILLVQITLAIIDSLACSMPIHLHTRT